MQGAPPDRKDHTAAEDDRFWKIFISDSQQHSEGEN